MVIVLYYYILDLVSDSVIYSFFLDSFCGWSRIIIVVVESLSGGQFTRGSYEIC